MNPMLKLCIAVMLSFIISSAYAAEPGNNIGTSLAVMKTKFPELRYIGHDEKGDKYEDGYPQDGVAVFFYFKNGRVSEECMIVQSTDGFPKMWHDQMLDEILTKYPAGFGTMSSIAHHWCYSTFQLHLIYIEENRLNTAMIIYEDGGYDTGVTGAEFFRKYQN